jgi:hypothetical protein
MQIPPRYEDETEAQFHERASKLYNMWKDWQEKAEKFDVIADAAGEEVAGQKVYGRNTEPTEEVKKLMSAMIAAREKSEKKKSNG